MKKKIIFSLFIAVFLIFLFWCKNLINSNKNGYDTSQQGTSENKGQFIPEQKTDYIFTTTTVEVENKVPLFFFLFISGIIIVIILKKNKQKKT